MLAQNFKTYTELDLDEKLYDALKCLEKGFGKA